jgi:TRAP-type C4-dicarboxylate transport system substrate-binding protein
VLGGPPTEMAKSLGAVLTHPHADVYQSSTRAWWTPPPPRGKRCRCSELYEVAKTLPSHRSTSHISLCANKQKWQSLPKDVRDGIMSVSGLTGAKFWGKNFFDTAEQGVIERAKAGNYELIRYPAPPEEVERWRKVAGEPIWNEWVKKMEGKGNKEAREVLDTAIALLKN